MEGNGENVAKYIVNFSSWCLQSFLRLELDDTLWMRILMAMATKDIAVYIANAKIEVYVTIKWNAEVMCCHLVASVLNYLFENHAFPISLSIEIFRTLDAITFTIHLLHCNYGRTKEKQTKSIWKSLVSFIYTMASLEMCPTAIPANFPKKTLHIIKRQ